MSLHRIPEGFAIGAGYALAGQGLGAVLAIAIALQNAVEGSVMAAPLKRGGLRGPSLIALVAATGMTVPLAALAGYALSLRVAGALPPLLALAAGALIYLTSNEIIPESHSHRERGSGHLWRLGGVCLSDVAAGADRALRTYLNRRRSSPMLIPE